MRKKQLYSASLSFVLTSIFSIFIYRFWFMETRDLWSAVYALFPEPPDEAVQSEAFYNGWPSSIAYVVSNVMPLLIIHSVLQIDWRFLWNKGKEGGGVG